MLPSAVAWNVRFALDGLPKETSYLLRLLLEDLQRFHHDRGEKHQALCD